MYLLFDIGGTRMRIATSDGTHINEPRIIATPQNFTDGMNMFRQTAQELLEGASVDGIAGGIAGAFNAEKTVLVNSPNLKDWQEKPLKESLQDMFSSQVSLDNDAVVVGLGEATQGAGRDSSIVVYYTISTGVGGVRIVDGRVEASKFGYESGHQIIDLNSSIMCKCGGYGHLESFVSGTAIKALYGVDAPELKGEHIWDSILKTLAVGFANVTVHWSPEIIVLGGGVAPFIDIEKLQTYLAERLPIFKNQTPKLTLATLGDKGGMYGALALATQ
jgi:glucokinase